MIFVTLGSQKFQFNRLLVALDRLVKEGKIRDQIIAQIGYSDYLPQHFDYERFYDREEFSIVMDKADVVITHGGTGAIIGAVKKGKKVIAVPRLAKYGEHVDDHQIQLVEQFKELNLIRVCLDCNTLDDILNQTKNTTFNNYQSNTERIIKSIEEFVNKNNE